MTALAVSAQPTPSVSLHGIADGQARRLHPASLMLAVLKVGPQSLNLLPAIAVIGATGRWWLIVPLMLLFLAIL